MADSDDCAWDADDFNPDAGFTKAGGDKWEGEDEGLEVPVDAKPGDGAEAKPRKSKAERIGDKKALRRKAEDENGQELTEEEEKLRKLMLQKEADLETAQELFGSAASSIPQSPVEFAELGTTLAAQISKFEAMNGYFNLLESLIRDSCVSLDAEDCRKLGASLNALAVEKSKLAREKKGVAKKKGKKLNLSKAAKRDDFDLTGGNAEGGGYDEDCDFI